MQLLLMSMLAPRTTAALVFLVLVGATGYAYYSMWSLIREHAHEREQQQQQHAQQPPPPATREQTRKRSHHSKQQQTLHHAATR